MTGAISRREFITALAAAGGFPEAKAIGVEITNHQNDFLFTGGPGDGQPMRDDIVRELDGQKVTLRL